MGLTQSISLSASLGSNIFYIHGSSCKVARLRHVAFEATGQRHTAPQRPALPFIV